MNKIIFLLIIIIISVNVNAWKDDTHMMFVENIYYSMPDEMQKTLNLSRMREGAVAPDKYFKDFKRHHYPDSLPLAKSWLNNKSDVSFSFGVAAHYISDSFVAAHNIPGENYNDHSYFESQVLYYRSLIKCKDYGFKLEDLKMGVKNKADWNPWLKSKDRNIPEKEVDEAMAFMYSIAVNYFNYTCRKEADFSYEPIYSKKDIIKGIIVLISGLPLLYFFKN